MAKASCQRARIAAQAFNTGAAVTRVLSLPLYSFVAAQEIDTITGGERTRARANSSPGIPLRSPPELESRLAGPYQ